MLNTNEPTTTDSPAGAAVSPKRYGIIQIVSDVVHNRLDIADDDLAESCEHLCSNCDMRSALLNICTACGCPHSVKSQAVQSDLPQKLLVIGVSLQWTHPLAVSWPVDEPPRLM